MHSGVLLLAAMGLTTLAWSEPSRGDQRAQPGEQQRGGHRSQHGGAGEVSECSPAQMAGVLEAINKSAIETAKLALSKSQNNEVREFAQKAIDSHTKLEKQLKDSLDEAGITPAESDIATRLEAESEQVLDALASSRQFDRDYAAHEVLAHAKDFGLLHAMAGRHGRDAGENEGETGTPDAVSSLVAKACEMFEKHERKALELESKVAGTCGAVSEPSGGAQASPY
jgi:putative membrane protein